MPYFVVSVERGNAWNWSLPMRRQKQWDEHAAFMDKLVEDRFILAGGPLGHEDRAPRIMHVVEAADEETVRARFATDPWAEGMLAVVGIEPWTVLLGGFDAAR